MCGVSRREFLGGFYGGKITAYPCRGFFQMNNDGYIGACESDLKSTISMLIMAYLTGRPGFISDPVIDTCRTKLAAEVLGDIDKLMEYWDTWGWHRVTFYGDLKRPVHQIAALLGFEVIEEA